MRMIEHKNANAVFVEQQFRVNVFMCSLKREIAEIKSVRYLRLRLN